MNKLRSVCVSTPCSTGAEKLGQPVPLLNLALAANSGWPQPAQWKMPSPYSLSSGLEPARSVPCSRNTRCCAGDSLRRHSSSLEATANFFADECPRPPRRPNRPSAMTFPSRIRSKTQRGNGAAMPCFAGNSVHPLALFRDRAEQFRRRAGDPTPDDTGQLVVAAAQPQRLALSNFRGGRAVPADKKQGCLPNLALVGHHHHRAHHNRKARRLTEVPADCTESSRRIKIAPTHPIFSCRRSGRH